MPGGPFLTASIGILLEKAMAPYSSTLAWKIPRTEEPGRPQSMGSQRVGHNWSDLAAAAACRDGWGPLRAVWLADTLNSHSAAKDEVVQSLCCDQLFATPWIAAQQASLSRPLLSPRACSNSCPLSRWCHPTISSSIVPFSSCPQSFPASGSFPVRPVGKDSLEKRWFFI